MFIRLCAICLLAAGFALPSQPLHARVLDSAAIMHQPEHNNMCAITFDDGPTAYTAELLDSLKAEGVRVTFFLLGKQIRYRPELVLRMVEEGHEVASHGYSHPNMRKLSPDARRAELEETNLLLAELGVTPRYFRPPYGKYDNALAALAESLGMSVVMWTTDSRDWKRRPADYRNLPTSTGLPMQPEDMRGVFLFHDTRKATVQDVRRIVSDLRAGGCQRFVTVSEYFEGLPPEEHLMATRPEAPRKEHPAPAEPAAETVQAATNAHEAQATPAGSTPVPLARSSSPWFWPSLFRSGG